MSLPRSPEPGGTISVAPSFEVGLWWNVGDAQEGHGDVVAAAFFEGASHKDSGASLQIIHGQALADGVVRHHVGQAVGAYEEGVAHLGAYGKQIDAYGVADAHGAGDQILERMVAGFVFGDESIAYLLGDEGVVVGELADVEFRASEIDTAIADLCAVRPLALEHQGGDGGAHALVAGIVLCLVEHAAVGMFEGFPQAERRGVGGGNEVLLGDGLQGEAACELARAGAAHAVGDSREYAALVGQGFLFRGRQYA